MCEYRLIDNTYLSIKLPLCLTICLFLGLSQLHAASGTQSGRVSKQSKITHQLQKEYKIAGSGTPKVVKKTIVTTTTRRVLKSKSAKSSLATTKNQINSVRNISAPHKSAQLKPQLRTTISAAAMEKYGRPTVQTIETKKDVNAELMEEAKRLETQSSSDAFVNTTNPSGLPDAKLIEPSPKNKAYDVGSLKRYRPAGSTLALPNKGQINIDFMPTVEKTNVESNSNLMNLQKDETRYQGRLSASYALGRWIYLGVSQSVLNSNNEAVYSGEGVPDNRHTAKPSGMEETQFLLGLSYYHKSFSGAFDIGYKPKYGNAQTRVLSRDNLIYQIPDNTYTGGQDIRLRAQIFADRYDLMSFAARGGYTIRGDRNERSEILNYANNGGAFQSGTFSDTSVRGGNVAFAGASIVFPKLLNLTLDYEYNHIEDSFLRYTSTLVNTEITAQSVDTHRVETLVEWWFSKYISVVGGLNYVFTKDNGGGKTYITESNIYGGRLGARLTF